MVAAVMRSFLSALDASRACTTSISICPSERWPAAGFADGAGTGEGAGAWSCARVTLAPRATTAAHSRAWGTILLNNGRIMVAFLLCLPKLQEAPIHLV